jgi:hypothetical protein
MLLTSRNKRDLNKRLKIAVHHCFCNNAKTEKDKDSHDSTQKTFFFILGFHYFIISLYNLHYFIPDDLDSFVRFIFKHPEKG